MDTLCLNQVTASFGQNSVWKYPLEERDYQLRRLITLVAQPWLFNIAQKARFVRVDYIFEAAKLRGILNTFVVLEYPSQFVNNAENTSRLRYPRILHILLATALTKFINVNHDPYIHIDCKDK